ncbi:MAG: hypothetical protein ACI9HK_003458 [Pirellulaceae bacterium]|jgi:hypothetical protein
MPRKPSKIFFVCETCGGQATTHDVRTRLGRCGHCAESGSWTIVVSYSETSNELSILGTLSLLAFGVGWRKSSTATNHTTAGGISPDVAQYLTEDRRLLYSRVVEYMRLRGKQELVQQGTLPCRVCDVEYITLDSKPWTQDGYCSKLCAARDGANSPANVAEVSGGQERIPAIKVVCPNGHYFEVLASFSGCRRPCTECGEKTSVP